MSIEEIKNIIANPKKINTECLKKNEKSFVFNLLEATRDVETKEKKRPTMNNKIIIEKIVLSIFFHQL